MIQIQQGQSNDVVLTLSEKATLTNPVYLFEFRNGFTNTPVYFIAQNVSPHTDRYDEFTITETSVTDDLDPLHGIVQLNPAGSWSYTVYEQSSTTNLDPTLTTSVVESGKVQVNGTADTVYAYEITPDGGQSVVYESGLGVAIDPNGGLKITQDGLKVINPVTSDEITVWNQTVTEVATIDSELDTIAGEIASLSTSKQNISEKGIANGYASLDGTGKVPASQLPATITMASEQEVLDGTNATDAVTPAAMNKHTVLTKTILFTLYV